jgi:short-subunit dehydrogenase
MQINRPLAVITGASSGLGAVFARKLAEKGYDLILAARRLERLEQLQREIERDRGVRVEPLCADLADEAQLEDAAQRLEQEPALRLLVNNAGFGTTGTFAAADFARQLEMHRLHILATLRLTRAVLPRMIARNEGAIINVSSVAGFFRSPGNVSYCATKGWMNDFTEGLRVELDATGAAGVCVQALCPGFTYTEFHDVMGVNRALIPKWLWMRAEHVVEESLEALPDRKLFVVPGWQYKLAVLFSKLAPLPVRLWAERKTPHKKGRV